MSSPLEDVEDPAQNAPEAWRDAVTENQLVDSWVELQKQGYPPNHAF